jgi:hypothetical protein
MSRRAIALDGVMEPLIVEDVQVLDAPKDATIVIYWPVSDGCGPSDHQLSLLKQGFNGYRVVVLPSTVRLEVLKP